MDDMVERITPEWLMVKNFTQLKFILWDTVLTTFSSDVRGRGL